MNTTTTSEENYLKTLFAEIECSLDFIDSDDDDDDNSINEQNPKQMIDNYVFVDVQGFKGSHNRFICKEFCLIDGAEIFHEMIQSPFPINRLSSYLRKQADWLTRYFHGLKYEDGDVHIIELTEKMFPKLQNKKILVKGEEKMHWLQYMFRFCGELDCVNIEHLNIEYIYREFDSSSSSSHDSCEFHRWITEGTLAVCARYNALLLQDLATKNVNALL